MRKWKANSYVLSVCVLISEYVRQQQQDAKQSGTGEDSVASLVDAPHAQPPPPVISRTSLNALARFLTLEIQHPIITNQGGFTTLKSLLRRLEISLDNERDFEQLSWQLVSVLTQIESPDAVCNVVEQITECVAPLQSARNGEHEDVDVDSASSTLVRTSLLGVFVRSFLLAVNRLLFDGLSRLFDDVQQYLEQFREDVEKEKKTEKEEEKDSSLELMGSPASQHLWNDGKEDTDELLLSPIQSGSATPLHNIRQSYLTTPATTKLDPQEKPVTSKAVREVNDPAVWSNDQLNYILSDMARELEGGRSSRYRNLQQTESQSTEEQLRLLRKKMDSSNPNVLFARYLSFLNDRDYQGALDSLHQYHDVLSPRPNSRASDNGGDGDGSTSGLTGATGLHFRGSGVQYAALNLAGLQILFDHYIAAQESIQEAIRVAQHHGDHTCVAFALAWLIHINQKSGKSKEAVLQLVTSCLDRAQELRLPSLQVLAMLTAVESDLLRGSTTRPETMGSAAQVVPHMIAAQAPAPRPLHIWSRLEEIMHSIASIATPVASLSSTGTRTMLALQMQAGVGSGADSSVKSRGTGMEWISSTEAILDTIWKLSGKVTISAAIGWSLFGQSSLEHVFSRIHLLCYEDSASTGEIALTVSQMAMSNLAQAKSGAFERALGFLVDVIVDGERHVERRHLLGEMSYQRTLHRLFFLWALQRGEFVRAEVHLNAIFGLSPQGKDFPAYIEALMLKTRLWTAVGDYPRSLELLESLEATCSEYGFVYLHAQALITTSRTRLQASAPHAPFASLNALLQGVDICKRHHYDLLLAEAHVVLAEIYIAMGKLQDAHALINDQMPLVMEHGNIDLRGECLLVLAKAMIASTKRSKDGAKEPSPAASKAIKLLSASAEMFSVVQNLRRLKEISYVQSVVYNHMAIQAKRCGCESTLSYTNREEAARSFLRHSAQLKRAAFFTVEPCFDLEVPDSIRQVIAHRSSEI